MKKKRLKEELKHLQSTLDARNDLLDRVLVTVKKRAPKLYASLGIIRAADITAGAVKMPEVKK